MHYINDYNYNGSAPHQVAGIVDQNSGSSFNFEWDLNGNMTLHSEMIQGITKQRRLCWDEENRLLLSADEEQLAGYVYDAAGMRTHKASGTIAASTVNGYPSYFGSISSMTLYPSELITVSTGMYTKHYYNGSQRLASRIGGGFAPHPDLNHYDPLTDQVELPHSRDYQRKAQALVDLWTRQAECAGLQPSLEFAYTLAEGNLHNPLSEPADGERYFYHSDHLGSSAFITSEMRSIREDLQKSNTTEQNGYATQFLAYMPFGETLNEQQNSSNYYSPFKFSAKEKDPEMRSIREDHWKINLTEQTGYSYFGARYYSPELSVWLSVDPLSDKYPSLSLYNYCALNPVMLVDPDGKEIINAYEEYGDKQSYVDELRNNLRIAKEGGNKAEIRNARSDLKANRTTVQGVDKFRKVEKLLGQFKDQNTSEFERLNNLEIDGKIIHLIINLSDGYGVTNTGASANGQTSYVYTNIQHVLDAQTGKYYFEPQSIQGNKINIVLFRNGQNLQTLANEFGDADFAVSNRAKSFLDWSTNTEYWKKGSTRYSFDYADFIMRKREKPNALNY